MENLTEEDLHGIVWGEHWDFEGITKERVEETSRWSMFCEKEVKEVKTGHFYNVSWQVGATENQECDLDARMVRVYPHQVTTTVYKTTPQTEE